MSVPFAELLPPLLAGAPPVAALLAGALGSGHCLAMCGGLVLAVGTDRRSLAAYHAGRLLAYAAVGALAAAAGGVLLGETTRTPSAWSAFAAVPIGVGLIHAGFRAWVGSRMHLRLPGWLIAPYSALWRGRGAFATGLLTPLLPCGWLHTFVLAAAATRAPVQGGALLLAFGLGTLPALSLAPALFRKILRPFSLRMPRVSGALLMVAGLATVAWKFSPLWLGPASGHCH